MDQIIEQMSNQHKDIYFNAQLKIVNITQGLRTFQAKMSKNQIQNYMSEQTNIFYMLEKLFKEANIHHVFNLVKSIQLNYNTMVALLQDMNNKIIQKIQSKSAIVSIQPQSTPIQSPRIKQSPINNHCYKSLKPNKLGGIMLYNENLARYIEDAEILVQIKIEKQNRLKRIKNDLFPQSLFEDAIIKDSDEATTDEITKYISQYKNKKHQVNYNSSEGEIQDILQYFQNSQKEAHNFLKNKANNYNQNNHFSFANIQRDIMYSNSIIKKKLIDKVRDLISKLNAKQQEFYNYTRQKQLQIQQLKNKSNKVNKGSQTQLKVHQLINNTYRQIKDLSTKIQTLHCIGRLGAINGQFNQHELRAQLQNKQIEIYSLCQRILQLQSYIQNAQQQFKKEMAKKRLSTSEMNASQEQTKRTQKQITITEQSNLDNTQMQRLTKKTRNNSSLKVKTNTKWRNSKLTNDGSQSMSFNDIGSQHCLNSDVLKKKYTQIKTSNTTTQQKKQSILNIVKQEVKKQFKEVHVQTQGQYKPDKEIQSKEIKENNEKSLKNDENMIGLSSSRKKQKINQNYRKSSYVKQPYRLQQLSKSGSNKIKKVLPNQLKKQKSKQNIRQSNNSKQSLKQSQTKVVKPKQEQKASQYIEKLSFNHDQENQVDEQTRRQLYNRKISSNSKNYKIFQVLQDEKEYQTQKNTERSQKHVQNGTSIINISQAQQKIANKLCKFKIQKCQSLSNVFQLIIYPSKLVENQVKSQIPQKKISQKEINANRQTLNVQATKDITQNIEDVFKNMKKYIKSPSSDPQVQQKKQKLKEWRQSLYNNLKQQKITQSQMKAILSVLHSYSDEQTVAHLQLTYPQSKSIMNNLSLNDLQAKFHPSYQKVDKKFLQTQPDYQIEQTQHLQSLNDTNNHKNHAFLEDSSNKMQKVFGQSLQFQLYHQNIVQNFVNTHKNCQQGFLCSHIKKYFENLMRYFDGKKKNERKSALIIHIQNIGQQKSSDEIEKKLPIFKQQNKKKNLRHSSDQTIYDERQHGVTKYKAIKRNTNNSVLPMIKASKTIARSSLHNLKEVK